MTTEEEISKLKFEYPDLYAHGFSTMDYNPIDGDDGIIDRIEEIDICRKWIQENCTMRKTINRGFHSYFLKHEAEAWAGTYISNGACIAAFILEGYRLKKEEYRKNCCFNLWKVVTSR